MLGRDLGLGTAYYRYNYDGYGEQLNGAGYDGANGLGRPWPLLAGERGHHAVMAGADATPQLQSMLKLRSETGLVPEQVWDEPPLLPNPHTGVPSAPLYTGRPTLSATPLVWGHSELVKLAIARARGVPVERLASVTSRYGGATPTPESVHWRDAVPVSQLPRGRSLLVEASDPFTLRFGSGQGQNLTERASALLGLGMYGVTVTATETSGWDVLEFARRFGADFESPHQVTLGVPLLQALPALAGTPGAP